MVIGEDPEDQLARYDENIEIDPHVIHEVDEINKRRFVDFFLQKKSTNTPGKPTEADPYGEENWDDNIENIDDVFEDFYKQYGGDWNGNSWKKNDEGIWEEWSTYNPDSKWDWYELGGRWSGIIKLKEGTEGQKGRAGVFGNEVGIDQAQKGDITNIDEIKTFAVVKNGEWHENGKMGWFGAVTDEKAKDEWDNEIENLLEDVSEDTLISIYDCHI